MFIERVAVLVFGELFREGIKTAEVRPVYVGSDHFYFRRLFHDGIVDAVFGNIHHVFMADTQYAVFFGMLVSQFGCLIYFGGIVFQFFKENPCFKAEYPGVPVKVPCIYISLCGRSIRFFMECFYIFPVSLYVSVTGLRILGRNAESDKCIVLCKMFGFCQSFSIGFFIFDQVVRRGDKDDLVFVQSQTGQGDSRCRIASYRFKQELAVRYREFFKLVRCQEVLLRIGNNELLIAQCFISFHRELEK